MPHVYIHVPFCKRKCPYCAFYSISDVSDSLLDRYVDGILGEVALRPWPWEQTSSLFLGGGTPTLLGPDRMHRLLANLPFASQWLSNAEVTMEANPGTIAVEQLESYRQTGVNRLSIGVQSLSPVHLSFLERIHSPDEAIRLLECALDSGFRVSADLMYGLPNQRTRSFQHDVLRLTGLGVRHLSCYLLSAEEQTPLAKQVRQGVVKLPSETRQASFLGQAHQFLRQLEWDLYEVSSAGASPADRCQQNVAYWERRPYIGLGPAAHSFDGLRRYGNAPSVQEYLAALTAGIIPPHFEETLTSEQHVLEILMLGLRTSGGLRWEDLALHCTKSGLLALRTSVSTWENDGYLRLLGDRIAPTAAGMLWADALPVWITQEAESLTADLYGPPPPVALLP